MIDDFVIVTILSPLEGREKMTFTTLFLFQVPNPVAVHVSWTIRMAIRADPRESLAKVATACHIVLVEEEV